MKKYLAMICDNVADEGEVGMIEVLTEKEAKEVCGYCVDFGNIEGDNVEYSIADMKEITDDEIKLLKKFGLYNITFGTCFFINKDEKDEYDWGEE